MVTDDVGGLIAAATHSAGRPALPRQRCSEELPGLSSNGPGGGRSDGVYRPRVQAWPALPQAAAGLRQTDAYGASVRSR